MKPNQVLSPLRAMGVFALFIFIFVLAMHTGLAAPQAQAEEPVITPTVEIEPTATSTPTEIIILPEPSSTPLPSDTPDLDLLAAAFEVAFTPDPVAPGDVVTASWLIPDYQGSLDGVELWFTLPTGFLPVEIGSLSFDSAINQLALPLSTMEGKVSWYIDAKAQPPFDCLVEMRYKDQILSSTKHSIGLRSPDLVSVEGGEASGYNGNIRVSFPSGALTEDADVLVRPPLSTELSLGGNPVELTAIGRTSGQDITKFAQPVTITIQYTDEQANRQLASAGMLDEHSLSLFYYDEVMATWRVLPTTVDPEANLLTAVTDHFTLADFKAQNWEAARLPSMAAFQVDNFTGAGTYSIPLQVPAGPAGLQPSLTLSYNSQAVDGASSRSQASWVGMGWSLDTGYIQRNMNGTPNYLGDDTFTLQANGVGGLLLPIPDQDGDGDAVTIDYHLANENFWRIRQYKQSETNGIYINDRSYWVVFAPDGTQYFFGRLASGQSHLASYPAYLDGDCSPIYVTAWQWPMTRVRNTFGKELSFTYSGEMLTKIGEIPGYNCTSGTYMFVSLYPRDITYANNRYRIEFVREQVRADYDTAWTDVNDTILFMRSRLQRVEVWHDPDGIWNSNDEVLIRKYVLGYGENNQQIMPGNIWPAGGKTPTLTSVTEYGLNGTTSLPATTFTYDELHLLQIDNGYGGQVNLDYSEWHAENSLERIICTYFSFPITSRMDIISQAIPDCTDVDGVFPQYYQPGGSYLINLQAKNVGGSQIKAGFETGVGDAWSVEQSIPADGVWHAYSFQVSLPGEAARARPLIYCNGCMIQNYEIRPEVTRYRVISKALTDQITEQTNTWSYNYSGAAVNDYTHSVLAATWSDGVRLLVDPYAEFRGHSQVMITAPDGGYTVMTFDQSDLYKGRAMLVETFAYGGARLSRAETQYDHQATATGNLPHPEGQQPWADLAIEWVYTTQTASYTYNGDSTLVGNRSQYEYDTYGNVTRLVEADWDPTVGGGQWHDFRLTQIGYAINTSGVYLVGLPAYQNQYTCRYQGAYLANGACSTSYPGWLPQAWLASSGWYLYDNNNLWNQVPIQGVLTGQRSFLRYASPPIGDPRYSDVLYTYDTWGNRTTSTSYSGEGTYYSLASAGARTSAVCSGGGGYVDGTACADDGYHTYPLWEQNALDHMTSISYDYTLGMPVSMTDPNNITTTAGYDSFGRLTSIVRVYDDISNPTVIVAYHEPTQPGDPFYSEARQRIDGVRYFTIRKYYGGLGTLLETQVLGVELLTGSQDVVVSNWQGYALEGGQVRAVQEQSVPYAIPAGYGFRGWDYVTQNSIAHTHTVLDEQGRPLTVNAPDGASTAYTYADGYSGSMPYLATGVTDALGHTTLTRADVWGRTILIDPPDGPSVSYTYDVSDRLVGVTYGTAATVLQYDYAGRKLFMDDPDMGDWSYTYDALGNLLSQADARGCTTALTYDPINRPESKSYSGSCGASTATVTYTYDVGANSVGQRTRMDDGSGYTTWSYDARGRVIETYQSVNGGGYFRTQWGYNSADLPVWMKYPASNGGSVGETVNLTYNNQMLLDRVYGTSTYVDDTWYDAAGRITLRELGTNYTLGQTYTYYPWTQQGGRLQNLQSGIPADQDSLQSLSYVYDEVGNVFSISDYKAGGTQTQTFAYDALDRLSSAVASGGTGGTYSLQNYTYNIDTGNLASNAGVTYTYDDNNHKHAVTGTSSGNIYSYDNNGNQTSRRVDGKTYTLIYDAENRLVQIKRGNNIQATYTYDGDGNRVKTVVGSTTTTYIGIYLEWTGSTTSMKKYYYAGGQRVAMRQGSSTLYFLLTDHLSSTAVTANSGGGLYGELRYYPWGGKRYDTGTTPTGYRYTGQREAEVGLYYYGARYYDPLLGRFASPDSIIPNPGDTISFDRYAYVRNNPIKYNDPTGHWICGDQYDPACAENPIEMAQYQIMVAGHQPTSSCIRNADCADAYDTFVAVTAILGYVPSMSEILYMTAGTEYYSYIDYKIGVRTTGQAGLARNYYEACDKNGCSGSELYAFFSGFQPWFGKPSVREKGSASTRAAHLIDTGLSNVFYGTGAELWNDVNQILDQDYADRQGWTDGAMADEPWQWYGPFSLGINRTPSFGPENDKDAILSVDMLDGTVFWMFTFSQDEKFDVDYWSSPDEEQGN